MWLSVSVSVSVSLFLCLCLSVAVPLGLAGPVGDVHAASDFISGHVR